MSDNSDQILTEQDSAAIWKRWNSGILDFDRPAGAKSGVLKQDLPGNLRWIDTVGLVFSPDGRKTLAMETEFAHDLWILEN
jgi:hypothetical protein